MKKLFAAALLCSAVPATADAATVYSTDFDGTVVTGQGLTVTGFTNGALDAASTVDTLVDMSTAPALTFAHSGSTLTLGIQARSVGWQGGGDEAWGIDKLNITFDGRFGQGAIPEPATWAMMIAGFGLMGAALRRVRRSGRAAPA